MATGPVQLSPSAQAAVAKFGGMQVTPENVLGVVAVVREQVQSLRGSLQRFRMAHGEGMPMLGSDPVSASAARAFTEATTRLLTMCQDDINALNVVAQGLADAARAYGKTEAEITGAFHPHRSAHEPGPGPS